MISLENHFFSVLWVEIGGDTGQAGVSFPLQRAFTHSTDVHGVRPGMLVLGLRKKGIVSVPAVWEGSQSLGSERRGEAGTARPPCAFPGPLAWPRTPQLWSLSLLSAPPVVDTKAGVTRTPFQYQQHWSWRKCFLCWLF